LNYTRKRQAPNPEKIKNFRVFLTAAAVVR